MNAVFKLWAVVGILSFAASCYSAGIETGETEKTEDESKVFEEVNQNPFSKFFIFQIPQYMFNSVSQIDKLPGELGKNVKMGYEASNDYGNLTFRQ
ncbi:MAG: hypothetical protein AB1454_06360 [Candidatus Auribacterota bacterium]|jgi:hypothetical protein|uniref:Lipoprotein n=1 Tax=Candidatus Auribacter fodinae TaxID=2093366 RepID=A0A3A4QYX6_9BACT|nr:MAG: hypothetical protein C4541_10320 [Candidatus Auribacter fodinae]